MAFAFLLNPGTGPVDTILGKLGLPQPGWFNDPTWSKPALTLLALWGIGDLMMIFMASLLDVPREQYEAAELDGAGAVQRFRFITLPNIRADPGVRGRHRRDPDDAVLHRAVRRGEGRERADRWVGSAVRARLPRQVDPDASPAGLQPGFQRFDTGAACVVALVLFVLSMVFAAMLMRRGRGLLR